MRADALFIAKSAETDGIRLGYVVKVDRNATILVDFPGNRAGPLPAMISSSVDPRELCPSSYPARRIILGFDNSDPCSPIILGFLREPEDQLSASSPNLKLITDQPEDIVVDGKKLVFRANQEIVLHCGKGSVTIRADGKVIIKGTNVVSRASVTNKIKGGSVRIN